MEPDALRQFFQSQSAWTMKKLRGQILQAHDVAAKLPQYLTRIQLIEILVCHMRELPVPIYKRERKKQGEDQEVEENEMDKKKKKTENMSKQPVLKPKENIKPQTFSFSTTKKEENNDANDEGDKDDEEGDINPKGEISFDSSFCSSCLLVVAFDGCL